jgi:hypothetical protein
MPPRQPHARQADEIRPSGPYSAAAAVVGGALDRSLHSAMVARRARDRVGEVEVADRALRTAHRPLGPAAPSRSQIGSARHDSGPASVIDDRRSRMVGHHPGAQLRSRVVIRQRAGRAPEPTEPGGSPSPPARHPWRERRAASVAAPGPSVFT